MELIIIGLLSAIFGGLLVLAARIGKMDSKIDKILNNAIGREK